MLQYCYIIDSEVIFMMCARRIIVIFIRIGYGVFSRNGNLLINITAVPFRNHPDQIDLDSHN